MLRSRPVSHTARLAGPLLLPVAIEALSRSLSRRYVPRLSRYAAGAYVCGPESYCAQCSALIMHMHRRRMDQPVALLSRADR